MLGQTRQLVRAYLQGEQASFGPLLERLRPRLVLWSASRMSPLLRARLEPEDVAQEILLTIHRSIDEFRGTEERAFFAWLFRLAENRVRGLAKFFGAAKRQDPEPRSWTQTSPSSAAARTETQTRMLAAVDRLPEDYRLVLRLRRIEGRDVADTAEAMDRSPNAIRVLLCRAMKALGDALEHEQSSSVRRKGA